MKLIPLSTTSKINAGKYSAMVSDEDYNNLMEFKWHIMRCEKTIYAARSIMVNGRKYNDFMHRFLLGLKPFDKSIKGDHINHNGLDNQRHNIRKATNAQNIMNGTASGASRFLGVSLKNKKVKYTNKNGEQKIYQCIYYEASITYNGKIHYLGNFKDEILAAKKYDEFAREHFGEFANPNFKENK